MNELARSAVDRLRAHQDELRALGVRRLSLFGSTARGEEEPRSDVDVAVLLGPDFAQCGFAYFGELERLRERLTVILGRPVDIVEEPVERERLQHAIDEERVVAF